MTVQIAGRCGSGDFGWYLYSVLSDLLEFLVWIAVCIELAQARRAILDMRLEVVLAQGRLLGC